MMKKLLTFLLIAILTITPMQISFASGSDEAYISVSFSPESGVLSLEGADYLEQGSPVVMYMIPDGEEVTGLTPPILSEMFFAKKDGTFAMSAKVPSGTPNGKYVIRVGTEARESAFEKTILLYFKDSQETIDSLAILNGAQTYAEFVNELLENCENVGIDAEAIGNMNVFSKALWGIRESEGEFTLGSFANAVSFAKGAVILSDTQNVADVMKNYASSFDYTYPQYTSLSVSVRETADDMLLKFPTDKGYISYEKIVSVANLVCAPSYGRLMEIIKSDPENYGIEFDSKYNKLSANNKAKVFKMIFEQREEFMTTEDVSESFEDAVESLSKSSSEGGGGGGGGGGGSISDSKNHIGDSTSINGLTAPGESVKPKQAFADIESSFARESIEKLTELFIISGYADGTFRPENNVTRAEFCKIVCIAFGFSPSINNKFEDVSDTDWFAPYTGTLSSFGIVRGDGKNFNPQGYITRQDAAVILGNALEFMGKNMSGNYSFSDDENVSDYAKQKVSSMASMGYLKGDGVNFYPANNITRGETAVLVDRIYTSLN